MFDSIAPTARQHIEGALRFSQVPFPTAHANLATLGEAYSSLAKDLLGLWCGAPRPETFLRSVSTLYGINTDYGCLKSRLRTFYIHLFNMLEHLAEEYPALRIPLKGN